MEIKNKAVAGSVESGDVFITLEPSEKLDIVISSKFDKQYGNIIKTTIDEIVKDNKIMKAKIIVNDQGALPAVVRARMLTVIERAGK